MFCNKENYNKNLHSIRNKNHQEELNIYFDLLMVFLIYKTYVPEKVFFMNFNI